MTLYVVVADGYVFESYGSAMYLLGVFTSKELAAKCVAENIKKDPHYEQNDKPGVYDLVPEIIEVEGDKTFPLVRTDEPYETVYASDHYIGGYIE